MTVKVVSSSFTKPLRSVIKFEQNLVSYIGGEIQIKEKVCWHYKVYFVNDSLVVLPKTTPSSLHKKVGRGGE